MIVMLAMLSCQGGRRNVMLYMLYHASARVTCTTCILREQNVSVVENGDLKLFQDAAAPNSTRATLL